MVNPYHEMARQKEERMANRKRGISNIAQRPSQTNAYFEKSVNRYLKKTGASMSRGRIVEDKR